MLRKSVYRVRTLKVKRDHGSNPDETERDRYVIKIQTEADKQTVKGTKQHPVANHSSIKG